MSLFSSIQMAGGALRANDIALQVVGQNIANANTPGYLREEVVLVPAPTQKLGDLLLGTGVKVQAVVQKIDKFLEERLRGAVSDQASADTTQQTYSQLEEIMGELSDSSLSASMNNFFNSIAEILNQPSSASVRNMAVLQGETLTQDINQLRTRTAQIRSDLNDQVASMGNDINQLIEQIRVLNIRIANTEGGNVSKSDAVGLRDQREQALENLAKLIDIHVSEQPSGSVTVYAGGDYLVADGTSRQVKVVLSSDRGLNIADIRFADTDASLNPASGQLRGLLDSRDNVLGGFLDKLDSFANTLAFEFNKMYSSGQGLNGFSQLTSQFQVDDKDKALDDAGLKFTPTNGSFQIMVHNKKTDLTQTSDIFVHLDGLGTPTTLSDLADQLNNAAGHALSAEVTATGGLTISSTSPDLEFSFANDTSGILAALGLNTFFTGSNAADLGVNQVVKDDPTTFAASRGGIGIDTDNAVDLANFIDHPIAAQNGASVGVLYDRITAETTQGSTIAKAVADSAQVFENTLQGQKLATSGVNIDEEAISMISYQRAFQASAKYISTLTQLFDLLVQI